jgi:pimeloyl-ACP methyl ester carboxylesterase
VLHPEVVRRLVVVGAPHPLRMRQAIFGELATQLRASSYLLGFQLPWRPERQLVRDDAALVSELMSRWSGPGFPDPETRTRVRGAMQIPGVAHSSMEYYRWVFRSMFRPDGWRMLHDMREVVRVPTLQLQGLLDTCVLPETANGSGEYVAAPYTWRTLPGVGHFPHQEAPDVFNAELLSWLE